MNIEKEKRAIQYLKAFQPQTEPYFLCYSGGKDSDTILALAKLAGVKYEAVHNLTTVDAPETVQFIKAQSEIKIKKPEKTMWQLIVEKRMPPTRLARYCCEELKERGGKGRLKVTGVRWEESQQRKKNSDVVKIIGKPKTIQRRAENENVNFQSTPKGGVVLNTDNDENRRFVEHCYRTTSTMINPIVDWTDKDVLEFLCYYGVKINPLYEAEPLIYGYPIDKPELKDPKKCIYLCKGKKRIGCIGCPQNTKAMRVDFINYPKYRDNYLRAFKKMQEKRIKDGLKPFGNDILPNMTAQQIMMWWIGDDPRQLTFEIPEYLKGAVQL